MTLVLDRDLRSALVGLLGHASSMPSGARVDTVMGSEPWGDLDHFRTHVFDPVTGRAQAAPCTQLCAPTLTLVLTRDETEKLASILQGLSESMAGGVPWTALSDAEKQVVAGVVSRILD